MGLLIELFGFILIAALASFIGAFIEGAFQRRDLLVGITAVFIPVVFVTGWRTLDVEAMTLGQWKRYFQLHQQDWLEAEAWFQKLGPSARTVSIDQMPENLRKLASGGPFRVSVDKDGKYWFAFCIVSQGIDNDRVFLWSKEGGPPPEEAYPVIVKAWPMSGGWYFARTT